MPSKGVKSGVTWVKVAKLPWEPPKGHLAGGECFAPLTMMKHNEALCASTKILCSGMVIRCTETSFRNQFSWFLKIVEEHPNGSKLTPGYSWWLPDNTWMILDRFWDHQFFIISITLVTRKRKASRKTSAPRHDTATKTYLYVCSNFDLLSFINRRHHHRAHDTWKGYFAHVLGVSGQVTMGAPEGPSGGRRVLRTINNDET